MERRQFVRYACASCIVGMAGCSTEDEGVCSVYDENDITPEECANDGGGGSSTVSMFVGRGSAEATNSAIILHIPVENDGDVRATVEFVTKVYLDGEEHSSERTSVTLDPGVSRTVTVEHGVSRLDAIRASRYDYDIDVIDEYEA